MPRQLPWLNKGGGSRTQVKQPLKPALKSRIRSDTDDDFFEGTALESSRRAKTRAASQESGDDLPELLDGRGRTSRKGKEAVGRSRLPSSSPPPLAATLSPPEIEYMRKGVDKFDLRDDEWMMVEDELLQTAKLFTRHLHLAEYERMKSEMEERAKLAAARPVVPDVKPSDEGRFKQKAERQMKTQQNALKDLFTTGNDDSEEVERVTQEHADPRSATATNSKIRKVPPVQRLAGNNKSTSDSDDLDAPRRPTKHTVIADKVGASVAERDSKPMASEFVKPALPLNARGRAKLRRPTPFDMWDDFVPDRPSIQSKPAPAPTPRPQSTPKAQSSAPTPTPSSTASSTGPSSPQKLVARPLGLSRDLDVPQYDRPSKEAPARLVKRKAEKETEVPSKSSKSIDDIPTFLF